MAVRRFTTDELVSVVRERAAVPNTATTGTLDADLINFLNEELMATIVPIFRRVREEYFVISRRIPLVSGTSRYRIPDRAVGQQVRSLWYHDGQDRQRLVWVSPEMLDEYNNPASTDLVLSFYVEGNHIVITGSMLTASGSLEVQYLIRPGQLVPVSETRVIESVDTATKTITVTAAVPTSWETTSQGFDIHSAESGAELKQTDLTRDTADGVTITLNEEIDGSVWGTYTPASGDYICLAEEAAVPALPREWHPILAQAAVCRVLEQQGDMELLRAAKETLSEQITNAKSILANRVESHPKRVISRNPLWGAGRGAGWW